MLNNRLHEGYMKLQSNKKGLTISRKALNSMVAMGGIEPPTLGL
jgi:hypothetical protein